jgi:ribosomal protein S19E (S16A)
LVRKILQQLAHVEIVDVKADAKGRYLTSNGRRVLDTIAGQCIRN